MPSSHLILCRPLLLLPPIPPSIRVFSNESTLCMRCPKYWSFSLSISPSNEHPGMVSFRMDWLDLLAVQGTLKSLLQHHSSKASILRRLPFFTVQLSHLYMTTGKTIALTRWTIYLAFLKKKRKNKSKPKLQLLLLPRKRGRKKESSEGSYSFIRLISRKLGLRVWSLLQLGEKPKKATSFCFLSKTVSRLRRPWGRAAESSSDASMSGLDR